MRITRTRYQALRRSALSPRVCTYCLRQLPPRKQNIFYLRRGPTTINGRIAVVRYCHYCRWPPALCLQPRVAPDSSPVVVDASVRRKLEGWLQGGRSCWNAARSVRCVHCNVCIFSYFTLHLTISSLFMQNYQATEWSSPSTEAPHTPAPKPEETFKCPTASCLATLRRLLRGVSLISGGFCVLHTE